MGRIKDRAKKAPNEVRRMIEMSMDISDRIYMILDSQGKNQKDLAILLGKSESEISKWLSGAHNFTLKTLAKIENVLGERIQQTISNIEMQSVAFMASNDIVHYYIKERNLISDELSNNYNRNYQALVLGINSNSINCIN